jgi:hypothetical protein
VQFFIASPVERFSIPVMPPPTPLSLACLLAWLSVASFVPARVGETQDDLERRLFQPAIGKFLPREKNPNPYHEDELVRQQPFNQVRAYFPPSVRERKYWKSAVPNVLSNDNGWRLHVFFQDNVSVLEAYQRVGETLSEFEIQNILRANQGASEWQKVGRDSLEAQMSIIGCDYQLADGSLRARIVGNWLLVYSVKLDAYAKEQVRLASENQNLQEEERSRLQQLTAPSSTAGF